MREYFGDLTYLSAILLVPALAAFLYLAGAAAVRRLSGFVSAGLLDRLAVSRSRRARAYRSVLLLAAVLFLVLALMRPQWGTVTEKFEQRGIDLVVVIDVSRSMLAEDLKPDRLAYAREQLGDLIDSLDGDRIAIVPFSGRSFILCPLTLDYAAARFFAKQISCEMISQQGTAIAEALSKAHESLKASVRGHSAIVLISDGEDHLGETEAVLARLKTDQIPVYTVGVGTASGSTIPIVKEEGKRELMKDADNNFVLSRLNRAFLEKIGLESGGGYVQAEGTAMELKQISKIVHQRIQEADHASFVREHRTERFQIPTAMALVLLLIESLLGDTKEWWFLALLKRLFRRKDRRAPVPTEMGSK